MAGDDSEWHGQRGQNSQPAHGSTCTHCCLWASNEDLVHCACMAGVKGSTPFCASPEPPCQTPFTVSSKQKPV
eukprot:625316-Prorocentrum_minimum.AAC.2